MANVIRKETNGMRYSIVLYGPLRAEVDVIDGEAGEIRIYENARILIKLSNLSVARAAGVRLVALADEIEHDIEDTYE